VFCANALSFACHNWEHTQKNTLFPDPEEEFNLPQLATYPHKRSSETPMFINILPVL
jgi:hypothetical protein